MTPTSRTTGRTVFQASVSRSPKWDRTQSAMNWLGQHDVERTAVGLECAEFGRLQPAVKRARPKIPPKSAADRLPSGLKRRGNSPPDLFRRRIRPCALHWPAPPSS